jgi:hypothetical protein
MLIVCIGHLGEPFHDLCKTDNYYVSLGEMNFAKKNEMVQVPHDQVPKFNCYDLTEVKLFTYIVLVISISPQIGNLLLRIRRGKSATSWKGASV